MSNITIKYTIEYRPRSFNSKTDLAAQPITKRLGSGMLSMLQGLTGYSDQICIKKRTVTSQGTEKIEKFDEEMISTGITKEMVEKFTKNDLSLSGEDSRSIINFLNDITDQASTNLNPDQLRALSKLIY